MEDGQSADAFCQKFLKVTILMLLILPKYVISGQA
jgi:hypothetical protein